jgi:acyl carrier protein
MRNISNRRTRDVASITERVKKIVSEQLTVPEDQITPQKSFEGDLGADSIGLVELMMQFEDEFDMSIPDEEAEKIKTVGDAIKYIEEHQ